MDIGAPAERRTLPDTFRRNRAQDRENFRVQLATRHVPRGSSGAGSAPDLYLPSVVADRHIFNQYVIRTADRDRLKYALENNGVDTEIYYPVPMHLQECFAYLCHSQGDFPESESAARETLALPIYPELGPDQARFVVECVRDGLLSEPVRSGRGLEMSACNQADRSLGESVQFSEALAPSPMTGRRTKPASSGYGNYYPN